MHERQSKLSSLRAKEHVIGQIEPQCIHKKAVAAASSGADKTMCPSPISPVTKPACSSPAGKVVREALANIKLNREPKGILTANHGVHTTLCASASLPCSAEIPFSFKVFVSASNASMSSLLAR